MREGAKTSHLNLVVTSSRLQEEEEIPIHFPCQYPPARCRYRLFGSPILVGLAQLLSIDVKDIALLIKLSACFASVG